MKRIDIIRILVLLFAVADIFMALFSIIYLSTSSKKIQSLQLTPHFTETDLDLDTDYTFSASVTPKRAKLKKVKAQCDDPNSTFKMDSDGNITLHTSSQETTVTVYLEYKGIKSNVMTYQVTDLRVKAAEEAAAAAAAQAEAEAKAAEEARAAAEAAEAARSFVKVIGDNINVRASNSTDSESLGKVFKDEIYEKVEYVEDWTHILYNEMDGYVKSEFLTEVSRSEALGETTGGADVEITLDNIDAVNNGETVNTVENAGGGYTAEQQAAIDAAMKAAEERKKAEAEQQVAQDEAAAAQAAQEAAAQAAQAQAAAGVQLQCKDGLQTFTQQQYNFLAGFWYREGESDWKVHALVHTKDEIVQICQIEGGIY